MKILIDAIPMTGLLTGIARYLRNLYSTMDLMDSVELSYFDGKKLMHKMPPLADSAKWQQATNAIWNLPDPIVFSLRALHWLKYENKLNRICRKTSFDIYKLYICRRQRLKRTVLKYLQPFPRLVSRLRQVGAEQVIATTVHIQTNTQEHSCDSHTSTALENLTPQARRIYHDLKVAIEQRQKEDS